MSLDARTAQPSGGSGWITDEASRADVQVWRARSSAILTGAGTVRVDDPRLDVRLDYGPWVRQPLRVVLDTESRCAPDARIFHDGHALIFAASDAPERSDAPACRFARSAVPRSARGLDLEAVVGRLALLEVNELLVECGPQLAGAFLEANLVDELILYVAPHFLGTEAPPLAALAGAQSVGHLARFEFRDQRLIDNDLRLVLTPKRA